MDFLRELAVPAALLLLGLLGKLIVKMKWEDEVIFMGPDLILAGLGGALPHAIDQVSILCASSSSSADLHVAGKRLGIWFAYAVAALILYIAVLLIHQWTPKSVGRKTRICIQGGLCNFGGFAAMVAVFYLIRRF